MAAQSITRKGKKYTYLQSVKEGNEKVIDRIKETANSTKNAFKCKLLVHVADEVEQITTKVQAIDEEGQPKVTKKGEPVMVDQLVREETIYHVYIHKTK